MTDKGSIPGRRAIAKMAGVLNMTVGDLKRQLETLTNIRKLTQKELVGRRSTITGLKVLTVTGRFSGRNGSGVTLSVEGKDGKPTYDHVHFSDMTTRWYVK